MDGQGSRGDTGRAAELTPNRLNQGFSRTFVIRSLILARGIVGRRREEKVDGMEKRTYQGHGKGVGNGY